MEFWPRVAQALRRGESLYLAMVADHTKHSPGTRGAKLARSQSGELFGTIGGGIMEKRWIEAADASFHDGSLSPNFQPLFHRREAPGETSGMICAGSQTNVTAHLLPGRDTRAVEDIIARQNADEPGLLTYHPTQGLGVVDADPDPKTAPTRVVLDDAGWRYEEQLLCLKRAVIFGAGHCGLALSRQLHWLGYKVTICDTRPDVHTLEENTFARPILVEDYVQAAGRVTHPEVTAAVVMTADFPSDTAALVGALRAPFPYLGVMGAPAKLRAIQSALQDRGFSPEAIERVRGPIGVKIGSSTPEEIAVSVAAEIIQTHPEIIPGHRPTPFRGET